MMLRAILVGTLIVGSPVLAQLVPPKQTPAPAAVQTPVQTAAQTSAPATSSKTFREVQWDELVPKGWDPFAKFKGANLGMLSDSNPRVLELMTELRETLDNAPTVAAMNGAAVRMSGYVVPLEEVKGELKEFLLVPYFGACIHTPPPPSNQIVHVLPKTPAKGLRSMDVVWISGTLKTFRSDTSMGMSSYRMDAVLVEPYTAPAR